jgi:hypothetical protein
MFENKEETSSVSIVWVSYQWVMFENNEETSAVSIVWASYMWVMFEIMTTYKPAALLVILF